MRREICLAFADIKDHVDSSFFNEDKVRPDFLLKGQFRSNGKTQQLYDSVDIYLINELPDDYNERIEAMIDAIGGEEVLKVLISKYQAKSSTIILEIPCKSSEWNEEGYISCETMQKLYNLKLSLNFLFK